jgi:hypothetical protein
MDNHYLEYRVSDASTCLPIGATTTDGISDFETLLFSFLSLCDSNGIVHGPHSQCVFLDCNLLGSLYSADPAGQINVMRRLAESLPFTCFAPQLSIKVNEVDDNANANHFLSLFPFDASFDKEVDATCFLNTIDC